MDNLNTHLPRLDVSNRKPRNSVFYRNTKTDIRAKPCKSRERRSRVESETVLFMLSFVELLVKTMHDTADKNKNEMKGGNVEPKKQL